MPYRADIQGLRALAILLVVLGHAGLPGLPGGFVGVDVFYVLSGYLITGLLVAEYRASGTIRLVAFYARRLRRLLPALLAMLVVTATAAACLLMPYEARELTTSAAYAAVWTSNLYFAFTELDYFDVTPDLYLHTWSLGVEEQFYLVWPLLLLAALAGRGGPRRLPWILLAAAAASLVLQALLAELRPLWAFYLMPTRIWQFALGAAVALGVGARFLSRRRGPSGATGLALIVGSAALLDPRFTVHWLLLPSLGAALLLGAGQGPSGVTRLLAHPVAVWIGDRSYSWYLWHWPLLKLAEALGLGDAATTGVVAASLVVAGASYRVIERPLWKGSWQPLGRERMVILAAVLAMTAGAAAALRLPGLLRDPPMSPEFAAAGSARTDLPDFYRAGCDGRNRSGTLQPCVYGPADAVRTVVVVGDSVGVQWEPFVAAAFPASHWRTIVLTKAACPMVDLDVYQPRERAEYRTCAEWRRDVLTYLRSAPPSDLIVAGSAANYSFTLAQWRERSAPVLASLAASSAHLIVVAGNPSLTFDGPSCLQRAALEGQRRSTGRVSTCREPLVDSQARDVAARLREVVGALPNASFLDLNDSVCPGGWCSAALPDGTVVYRDRHHLTATFVRRQAVAFRRHLAQVGVALDGAPAATPPGAVDRVL